MSDPAPNILWIVTTQWRAQACGYMGDGNAHTPVLDALAGMSVNYAQAVTPHPFGPFARAAMLTGVPSPQNGVQDYYDPLPPLAPTVAHALSAYGYQTAFFGKWHLAPRDPQAPLVGEVHARTLVPASHRGGFEFWEGFESGFLINDPWLHGTRLPKPVQYHGYQSDVVCERAAEFLSRETKPWFGVVSLESPHPPYDAPAGKVSPMAATDVRLRCNVPAVAADRASRELAGYYAHITATDAAIGRLLSAVGEDTVVVFTSVHGDMHGSHGLFRKGWPHEESVRVPLLVRHPGLAAGRNDETVSLLDFPAMTQAWAVGATWVCPRDHAVISMPSVVNLPDQCDREWRGVRTARHKLILQADGEPWLLYDLVTDPDELHNLVGDPSARADLNRLRNLV